MKKVCLFILLALFSFYFSGCDNTAYEDKSLDSDEYLNKQISNVNKDIVPDSILEKYKVEAEILTARLVQADPKLSSSLIRLPNSVIQLFTNALIQVYNAHEIPERDVVIEQFNISVLPIPTTHIFYVSADTSKFWVKKWLSGNLFTGNAAIDSLIMNYEISASSKLIFPNAAYFFFRCEPPLNLTALCNLFSNIDGVIDAFPEGLIGDGNNIVAELFDDYILLTYSYGFGDCPSGCINRHFWKFKVFYNGTVQFVGDGGSPI